MQRFEIKLTIDAASAGNDKSMTRAAVKSLLIDQIETLDFAREVRTLLADLGTRPGDVELVVVGEGPSARGSKQRAPASTPVAKDKCAPRGKIPTRRRERLPDKAFAMPRMRKYPLYRMVGGELIPSGSHAANAKARAAQQLRKGNLNAREYAQIIAKADKVLRACKGRGGKRKKGGERNARQVLGHALRRDR